MNLPSFWAKGVAEGLDRDGRTVSYACWRSSDRSESDARESAVAAARRTLQSWLRGDRLNRYGYGEAPLREEIVERFAGAQGELVAAVTRNAYGVLVLNTDRVMFIDVDFQPASFGESLRYLWAKLFGRAGLSPQSARETESRRRLEEAFGGARPWCLRLYRTCAGMRALAAHDVFDPASDAATDLLRRAGADPLYVQLCKAQRCFRARLTPKPWRCGHAANPVRWPFEDAAREARFRQWASQYDAKQSRFATCRFLGTLGDERVHPEAADIIEVHDRLTRCREPLPLA